MLNRAVGRCGQDRIGSSQCFEMVWLGQPDGLEVDDLVKILYILFGLICRYFYFEVGPPFFGRLIMHK